jgi:hypothetical protein
MYDLIPYGIRLEFPARTQLCVSLIVITKDHARKFYNFFQEYSPLHMLGTRTSHSDQISSIHKEDK